jgi:Rrf2 family nitric oxide-sensitive transcriptional repressor
MQMTRYTDYALRVLLYLGTRKEHRGTVAEIAKAFSISRNHLTKVVQRLAEEGFLETARGKMGGIRLAHPPDEINIGLVVRCTEPHFQLAECFDPEGEGCRINAACRWKGVLAEAMESFMETLDKHSLADLLVTKNRLARALGVPVTIKRQARKTNLGITDEVRINALTG